MRAKRKSIHARLYRFTYISDLPQNLCPYFYKCIFAFLVFIPNFIIQIPSLIVTLLVKNHGLDDAKERRDAGFVLYLAGTILYWYSKSTIHWIMAMFSCDSYSQVLANSGWVVNAIILIGISAWLIIRYMDKRQPVEEKPNIITEFIKAKYNHYCPKIDWE